MTTTTGPVVYSRRPRLTSRTKQAVQYVASRGSYGATSPEYEATFGLGHGAASGALSRAHQMGYLARLDERRGPARSAVYVAARAEFIQGRATVPPTPNKPTRSVVLDRSLIEAAVTDWMAGHARSAQPRTRAALVELIIERLEGVPS